MQAIAATQRGPYHEVLSHQHVPAAGASGGAGASPSLDKHQVLIKVAFSDLNPVDLQKLQNGPPVVDENVFLIPGYGGSGTVEQVGSAAPKALVGRQVCFLVNPESSNNGSYASHVVVDHQCVAALPPSGKLELRDVASIPVAGLTAYECLVKLGLAADTTKRVAEGGQLQTIGMGGSGRDQAGGGMDESVTTRHALKPTVEPPPPPPKVKAVASSLSTADLVDKTLLIVGASGGVGSWILTLAKAFHPNLNLIATTGGGELKEQWCKSLGATKVIRHSDIGQILKGGKEGSVDYIICLTEPTTTLFTALSDVIKPYGKICLVVSGKSIESLNLGFCFFKCANVYTETVFSSIRDRYKHILPKDEMSVILDLMAQQTIKAPLSPDLTSDNISEKFSGALKDNGVLKLLSRTDNKRGNLVMMVHAGDGLIFMDFKTASIFSIPRKECIKKKIVNKSTKEGHTNDWIEQAPIIERQELLKKITADPKLGITKVAEKQAQDYQDGLELQEAENVKSKWGVTLKKREKNAKGEELMFVDLRTGALGELSRKKILEMGAMTLGPKDEEGQETVVEAVTDFAERDDLCATVRQALKINLEG